MKIKKIAKEIAKWSLILTAPIWPVWVWAPTDLVESIYPNIKSSQEAYRIFEEEKNKLKIKKSIDLRIYENDDLREFGIQGCAGKLSKKDGFFIGINSKDLNRIVLRHELYHIYKGDCKESLKDPNDETKEGILNYYKKVRKANPNNLTLGALRDFYLIEPRTNIYSITGIKI